MARPVGFGAVVERDSVVVVGTDGLFSSTSIASIAEVVGRHALAAIPEALVARVQGSSAEGRLWDDVGVVAIGLGPLQ